jgi:hypothetical protein
MKRTAINFIGRKLNSTKIKFYENKYSQIKIDWSDKPWEDYAKDCFKQQTQIKEYVLNSTGTQRMEYILGLQALYNICEKELDFVEEKVQSMSISELKYFFKLEYNSILEDLKGMNFNTATELYVEYGKIANSNEIKLNYMWKYVSACLLIFAYDEIHGKHMNSAESNIIGIKNI